MVLFIVSNVITEVGYVVPLIYSYRINPIFFHRYFGKKQKKRQNKEIIVRQPQLVLLTCGSVIQRWIIDKICFLYT